MYFRQSKEGKQGAALSSSHGKLYNSMGTQCKQYMNLKKKKEEVCIDQC